MFYEEKTREVHICPTDLSPLGRLLKHKDVHFLLSKELKIGIVSCRLLSKSDLGSGIVGTVGS